MLALSACALLLGCSASSRQIAALKNTPEPAARVAAVQELAKVPADGEKRNKIVAALTQATVDPDPAVRKAAVEALGKQGGDQARAALLSVVQGKNFAKAEFDQLNAADDAGGDSPELLGKLGQAELDLGETKKAFRHFKDLEREIEGQEPQQAMQQLFTLRNGYTRLQTMFLDDNEGDLAKEVGDRLAKVDEQLQAAQEAGGGMGGMGGMGNFNFNGLGGGLGGMPFSP